jgi:formylglycine-generating enzyme required for sulfatase activity
VNWNDAQAACQAAGGRLCKADEWRDACDGIKGSGGLFYPYGNKGQRFICNGYGARKEGALPTGSMPRCVSKFGAYDMSGNVWEWTDDSCGSDCWVVRSGSYFSIDADALECSYRFAGSQSFSNNYHGINGIGFRCCRDK